MKCLCKRGCDAWVKGWSKKYARGHSPASHQDYEDRGRKISVAMKKYYKRHDGTFKGRKHSEATLAKFRAYHASRPRYHDEAIKKAAQSMSKEHKAKAARVLRQYYLEHGPSMAGHHHSAETKKKLSETRKKLFASGELKGWNDGKRGLQVAWNKGLTRKTSAIIAAYAKKNEGVKVSARFKKIFAETGFRSRWEQKFAMACVAKREPFVYEPKLFKWEDSKSGKKMFYKPDFYLPMKKMYVEVKGWYNLRARRKIESFRRRFPRTRLEVWGAPELRAFGCDIR